MKRIIAEGIEYHYFSAGEDIPSAAELGIHSKHRDLDYQLAKAKRILPANISDLRLVILQGSTRTVNDQSFIYYLHWEDGTDLNMLDHKVESGSFTDDDFHRSLLVEDSYTGCNRG